MKTFTVPDFLQRLQAGILRKGGLLAGCLLAGLLSTTGSAFAQGADLDSIPAPTGLRAVATGESGKVRVLWNRVPDAGGYELRWRECGSQERQTPLCRESTGTSPTTPTGGWTGEKLDLPSTAVSWTVEGLADGKVHEFAVSTKKKTGDNNYGNDDIAEVETGVIATPVARLAVPSNLAWQSLNRTERAAAAYCQDEHGVRITPTVDPGETKEDACMGWIWSTGPYRRIIGRDPAKVNNQWVVPSYKVVWNKVEGATGYTVQYSVDSTATSDFVTHEIVGGGIESLQPTDATPPLPPLPVSGSVRIKAKGDGAGVGDSKWSLSIFVVRSLHRLSKPKNVRLIAGEEMVTAKWAQSGLKASGFELRIWPESGDGTYCWEGQECDTRLSCGNVGLNAVPGDEKTCRVSGSNPGASVEIQGLTVGTGYVARVRATAAGFNYADSKWSNWSTVATVQPVQPVRLGAPGNLALTNTDGEVTATWDAPTGAAPDGYQIRWRRLGVWKPSQVMDVNQTTATVKGLALGHRHWFQVRAVSSPSSTEEANSDWYPAENYVDEGGKVHPWYPEEASIVPVALIPTPAMTVRAGDTQVELSWEWVEGAKGGYEIRHCPTPGENDVACGESGGSEWTTVSRSQRVTQARITGLTNGTKYDFQMRALAKEVSGRPTFGSIRYEGNSEWSGVQTVMLNEKIVRGEIFSLVATGDGKLKVSWTDGSGRSRYEVRWRDTSLREDQVYVDGGGDTAIGPGNSASGKLKVFINGSETDAVSGSWNSQTVEGSTSFDIADGLAYRRLHAVQVRSLGEEGEEGEEPGPWSARAFQTPVPPRLPEVGSTMVLDPEATTIDVDWRDYPPANSDGSRINLSDNVRGYRLAWFADSDNSLLGTRFLPAEYVPVYLVCTGSNVDGGPTGCRIAMESESGSFSYDPDPGYFGTRQYEITGVLPNNSYRVEVTVLAKGGAFRDSEPTSMTSTTPSPSSTAPLPAPEFDIELTPNGARAALQSALSTQARDLLDEASDAIGRRMASSDGSDLSSSLTGLLDGGGTGAVGWRGSGVDRFGRSRIDSGISPLDLSDLRDLVRERGLAVSLTGGQGPNAAVDGPQLALWGEGGPDGSLWWGMDARRGDRWLAGVSWADGAGGAVDETVSFRGQRVSGRAESEVSAAFPYMRGRLGERLEVWSVAGWGDGKVDSEWRAALDDPRPELETEEVRLHGDLAFQMGLFGAESRLWQGGGYSLTAVGDVARARLAGVGGTADEVVADVSRTRLGFEGRREPDDANLAWRLRVSGRMDGGDGATASGVEMTGDLRRSWGRLDASTEIRWFDAGGELDEAGAAASFGMRERADGTGLSFALSPGYGDISVAGTPNGSMPGFLPGWFADDVSGSEPTGWLSGRASWGLRVPDPASLRAGLLRLHGEMAVEEEGGGAARIGGVLEGRGRLGLELQRQYHASGVNEDSLWLGMDIRF